MIETIIDFITQSPYLAAGIALIVASVILTVLNGLIDIAIYIAIVGGFILTVLGGMHIFFPEQVPITFYT